MPIPAPPVSTSDIDAFVFPRTLPPMAYQYYCMKYKGEVWSLGWAMFVYIVYFILFSKMALSHFNRLVAKYGTLDNNAPRDQVPDIRVTSTGVRIGLSSSSLFQGRRLLTRSRHRSHSSRTRPFVPSSESW